MTTKVTSHGPRLARVVATALAALAFALGTAFAGTPLICFPFEIGAARSLPGGTDWPGVTFTYNRGTLVADTLALLTPDTPILVRMETLRRAAVYATPGRFKASPGTSKDADRSLAFALLEKLRERAQDAAGPTRALAVFDVGYFSETLRHAGVDAALDGYALLTKALELRGGHDPEIEFALALASGWPKRPEHAGHIARARAGAKPGTLLAANVESHFGKS